MTTEDLPILLILADNEYTTSRCTHANLLCVVNDGTVTTVRTYTICFINPWRGGCFHNGVLR